MVQNDGIACCKAVCDLYIARIIGKFHGEKVTMVPLGLRIDMRTGWIGMVCFAKIRFQSAAVY